MEYFTPTMRSFFQIFLIFILIGVFAPGSQAQTVPSYGSNHGKYCVILRTKIYYEEYGTGTPLLLLHGGAGSIADFQKVIAPLAKHYRVILPDSPGHGRSEQADSLGYQLLANYFSKLIDALHLDSVYVIGFSDGGNAALILAADRPDKVKRVLVSGANASTAGLRNKNNSSAASFTPDNVEKGSKDWLAWYQGISPQKDNWRKFVDDSRRMWMEPIAVPEDKLKKIKSRTLIVMGDRDIITPEHGNYLNTTIPSSELYVIKDCGHYTFALKPDEMTALARNFFDKR